MKIDLRKLNGDKMKVFPISDEIMIKKENYADFLTVFDMRELIQDDNEEILRENFESVIGTRDYAKFLYKMLNKSKAPFESDKSRDVTGYLKNRVFKKRIIDEYIFPNLLLDLNKFRKESPELNCLINEFKSLLFNEYKEIFPSTEYVEDKFFKKLFEAKVTLSLNGSISVRIRIKTTDSSMNEINLLNDILHSKSLFNEHSFADHDICGIVLSKFFEKYGEDLNKKCEFEVKGEEFKKPLLNFNLDYFKSDGGLGLVHQHYYILSTEGFESKKTGNINIQSIKTEDDYRKQIMCYLRGTLVNGKCSNVKLYEYPIHYRKIDYITDCDLSGQEDGLCLFTPRKALIVHDATNKGYWNGMTRGLELMLTLKVELAAMEYHITFISERIPRILKELHQKKEKEELQLLEKDLGDIISTIQRFRILLVPNVISSTTSIIKKFEALIRFLGLKPINEHIESNIQELNSLLADSNKINLMDKIEGSETSIKNLNFLLTFLAALQSAIIILEVYLLLTTGNP
jgi:hypothetical protein